ncbi:hypothetical protein LTR37_019326 [Vermiconidia calcicola]|uniref:Uncharacterized protein n=1 Tax=Vermiconidia calcicola TaxID=1690605 RepID=A0ACC3MFY5_9PEZI|nr:hypothetical protein LTR37_019326 [Vermiconidia calcicola]
MVTTIGYAYFHLLGPGQNTLEFGTYRNPRDRSDQEFNKAVLYMAHGLGHAIGLQHEHQRPDRDQFIKFQCENLPGYAQVKEKVAADDEDIVLSLAADIDERMEIVCGGYRAAYFWPLLTAYAKADRLAFDFGRPEGTVGDLYESGVSLFDFNSIMHYGSDYPDNDLRTAIFLRKPQTEGYPLRAFWQGGDPDPASRYLTKGQRQGEGALSAKTGGSAAWRGT